MAAIDIMSRDDNTPNMFLCGPPQVIDALLSSSPRSSEESALGHAYANLNNGEVVGAPTLDYDGISLVGVLAEAYAKYPESGDPMLDYARNMAHLAILGANA